MPYHYSDAEVARAKAQAQGKAQQPKLNRKINGRWVLSGDYLQYRAEEGSLSPEAWNSQVKDLSKKPQLRSRYVDKLPIIALMLGTQPRWFFHDLVKDYGWTREEVQAAREYLAALGRKPYGET
jgi:1,2-phenylacetyl-CoA epoxidase catalytic subunit